MVGIHKYCKRQLTPSPKPAFYSSVRVRVGYLHTDPGDESKDGSAQNPHPPPSPLPSEDPQAQPPPLLPVPLHSVVLLSSYATILFLGTLGNYPPHLTIPTYSQVPYGDQTNLQQSCLSVPRVSRPMMGH